MPRITISVIVIALLISLSISNGGATIIGQGAVRTKYVIFRDDDVAPGAPGNLAALKAVNQIHIDHNIPVTLGIIPHLDGSVSDTRNFLLSDSDYIAYLRSLSSNTLFEFAQHGYTHDDTTIDKSGSEFRGFSYDDQYYRISKGQSDITQAFGVKPPSFIPPWDTGDENTLRALQASGFTDYCSNLPDVMSLAKSSTSLRLDYPLINFDNAVALSALERATDQYLNDMTGNDNIVVVYHYHLAQGLVNGTLVDKTPLLNAYLNYLETKPNVIFTTLSRSYAISSDAGAPNLTLATSNPSPSSGQQYTISGYLRDSAGNALAYKPIDIYYRFSDGVWHLSNTIYTDANGKYSTTTTSSSQTVTLQTGYKVGSTYVASSNLVTISPPLTLSSSNYHPAPGQSYTLSGRLTDSSGNPLANKPIDIYYHTVGGAWQFSNTIYTGSDGTYSTTTTSSSQTVTLQTGYKVGSTYVASSNVLTINVQNMKIT